MSTWGGSSGPGVGRLTSIDAAEVRDHIESVIERSHVVDHGIALEYDEQAIVEVQHTAGRCDDIEHIAEQSRNMLERRCNVT